jgi:hypothetical protein
LGQQFHILFHETNDYEYHSIAEGFTKRALQWPS